MEPNGAATFSRPDGTTVPSHPAPASPIPATALADLNHAAGLAIHPETNLSQWTGETPDYDWITAVMASRKSTPQARDESRPS